MNNTAKRGVVLVGFVAVIAVFAFCWRSPAEWPGNAPAGQAADRTANTVPPEAAASKGDVRTQDSAPADMQKHSGLGSPARKPVSDSETASEFRNAAPSTTLTAFEAEAQMLGPGGRGINIDASSAVLMNKSFELYMDALADQALRESLAADLTRLYRGTATDGARSLEGVSVRRVVCGLKVCLASGTAASNEALKPWQEQFSSNPSAPTYDSMAVQLLHPDGSVEFRIVFATDPASRAIRP